MANELNRNLEAKACAVFYDGWYRLAYPSVGDTCAEENDRVIVVSLDGEIPRFGEQTGQNIGRFCHYKGGGDKNELYYTDSLTGHIRQAETGTDDDDVAISYEYETGFLQIAGANFDFGVRRFYIDYEGGVDDTMTILTQFDRDATMQTSKNITLDATDRAYFGHPMGIEGRQAKTNISGSTDAALTIHRFAHEIIPKPRRRR